MTAYKHYEILYNSTNTRYLYSSDSKNKTYYMLPSSQALGTTDIFLCTPVTSKSIACSQTEIKYVINTLQSTHIDTDSPNQ